MRDLTVFIFLIGCTLGVAAADTVTVADLDKLMRKVGAAQQLAQKAIASGKASEANTQLAVVKASIRDAQGFWVAGRRDDAVAFGKTVLEKLDALEKLVSAPVIDASATSAAVRELSAACSSCHRVYRTTDEENNFILKPMVAGR